MDFKMNERIKELAKEAAREMNETGTYSEPKFQAKFAELIVRQCAEIADTERPNSVGCGYITKTNGMRIKEHFGVEE
jgi:hypothetical protein